MSIIPYSAPYDPEGMELITPYQTGPYNLPLQGDWSAPDEALEQPWSRNRSIYENTIIPSLNASTMSSSPPAMDRGKLAFFGANFEFLMNAAPVGPLGTENKGKMVQWLTAKAWRDPSAWWAGMFLPDYAEGMTDDITELEFEEMFGSLNLGIKWSNGMTWGEAGALHSYKFKERDINKVIGESHGLGRTIAFLPAGMVAGMLTDPLYLATSFISYGAITAKLGLHSAGRFMTLKQMGAGYVSGTIGAAVTEIPFVYLPSKAIQSDYNYLDSSMVIAFGGLFGAAIPFLPKGARAAMLAGSVGYHTMGLGAGVTNTVAAMASIPFIPLKWGSKLVKGAEALRLFSANARTKMIQAKIKQLLMNGEDITKIMALTDDQFFSQQALKLGTYSDNVNAIWREIPGFRSQEEFHTYLKDNEELIQGFMMAEAQRSQAELGAPKAMDDFIAAKGLNMHEYHNQVLHNVALSVLSLKKKFGLLNIHEASGTWSPTMLNERQAHLRNIEGVEAPEGRIIDSTGEQAFTGQQVRNAEGDIELKAKWDEAINDHIKNTLKEKFEADLVSEQARFKAKIKLDAELDDWITTGGKSNLKTTKLLEQQVDELYKNVMNRSGGRSYQLKKFQGTSSAQMTQGAFKGVKPVRDALAKAWLTQEKGHGPDAFLDSIINDKFLAKSGHRVVRIAKLVKSIRRGQMPEHAIVKGQSELVTSKKGVISDMSVSIRKEALQGGGKGVLREMFGDPDGTPQQKARAKSMEEALHGRKIDDIVKSPQQLTKFLITYETEMAKAGVRSNPAMEPVSGPEGLIMERNWSHPAEVRARTESITRAIDHVERENSFSVSGSKPEDSVGNLYRLLRDEVQLGVKAAIDFELGPRVFDELEEGSKMEGVLETMAGREEQAATATKVLDDLESIDPHTQQQRYANQDFGMDGGDPPFSTVYDAFMRDPVLKSVLREELPSHFGEGLTSTMGREHVVPFLENPANLKRIIQKGREAIAKTETSISGFKETQNYRGGYIKTLQTFLNRQKFVKESSPIARIIRSYIRVLDEVIRVEIANKGLLANDLTKMGYDAIRPGLDEQFTPLRSVEDFVTHALMNPEFQKQLAKISVPNKKNLLKTRTSWDQFMDSVREISGVTNRNKGASTLEDVISSSSRFLEEESYRHQRGKEGSSRPPQTDKKMKSGGDKNKAEESYRRLDYSIDQSEPLAGLKMKMRRMHDDAAFKIDKIDQALKEGTMSATEHAVHKQNLLRDVRGSLLDINALHRFEALMGEGKMTPYEAIKSYINGSRAHGGADQRIRANVKTFLGAFISEIKSHGLESDFTRMTTKRKKEIYEAIWEFDTAKKEGREADLGHISNKALTMAQIIMKHKDTQMAQINMMGGDVDSLLGHVRSRRHSPERMGRTEADADRWVDFCLNNNINTKLTFGFISRSSGGVELDWKVGIGNAIFSKTLRHNKDKLWFVLDSQGNIPTAQAIAKSRVTAGDDGSNRLRSIFGDDLTPFYGRNPNSITNEEWARVLFPDGMKITEAKYTSRKRAYLKDIHERILDPKRGEASNWHVGDSFGRSKTIIFEDWNSNLKYDDTYGGRSLPESILMDMESNAKSLGMMEYFGRRPHDFFDEIEKSYSGSWREDGRKSTNPLERANIVNPRKYFDKLSGESDNPANIVGNRLAAMFRSWMIVGQLEQAVISSFPDIANLGTTLEFMGMKRGDQKDAMKFIKTDDARDSMAMLGIGAEAWMGESALRFGYSEHAPALASNVQRTFFKYIGMNWWNRTNQGRAVTLMSAHLGNNSSKAFSELGDDLRRTLSRYGITDEEWDVLRTGSLNVDTQSAGSRPFIALDSIREADIGRKTDLATKRGVSIFELEKQIERKLSTFYTHQMDHAVLMPGNWEMTNLHAGTKAGTILGETARFASLYKAFSLSQFNKITGEYAGKIRNNPVSGSLSYFLYVTKGVMLGYLTTSIKDILRNKTPADPTSRNTFIKALKASGVTFFLGDALLGLAMETGDDDKNIWGKAAGDIATYLSGPAGQMATRFMQGATDEDSDRGKVNMAKTLIHGGVPFLDHPLTSIAGHAIVDMLATEFLDYSYWNNQNYGIRQQNGWLYDVLNIEGGHLIGD